MKELGKVVDKLQNPNIVLQIKYKHNFKIFVLNICGQNIYRAFSQ